jgi:carboxylate-amine ligase
MSLNLRDRFDAVPGGTVGLEEELLLLDPATLAPKPCVDAVLERSGGSELLKRELPAAQIELLTRPHARVDDALAELATARAELLAAAEGIARPAGAALHPTAPAEADLNPGERYDRTHDRHASIARRQLLGSLQVHVAVGGADRTLAVYNALRGLLPELAALAAAAPFHENRDTGLASMRPLVGGMLPRQGVPPAFDGWDALEAELAWGRAAGAVEEPRMWWWELRPHFVHGTLELRVPDVQPTLAAAEGVAAFAVALVGRLTERYDAGEQLGAPATWRIEENRWAALRHGVEGTLADLDTGERRSTRERLLALVEDAEPFADRPLTETRSLIERNTAMELRQAGLEGATAWLTDRFAG